MYFIEVSKKSKKYSRFLANLLYLDHQVVNALISLSFPFFSFNRGLKNLFQVLFIVSCIGKAGLTTVLLIRKYPSRKTIDVCESIELFWIKKRIFFAEVEQDFTTQNML